MVLACFRPFNIAHKHRCLLKNVIYHNVQCNFKHGSLLHFRKSIQTSVLLQRARNETSKIVQDKKSYAKSIKRLLSLAGPEKYPLAAAISLLVISSSVTMSIPFALGKVIDIIYSMDQIKTKANLKGVNHKDQTNDVIFVIQHHMRGHCRTKVMDTVPNICNNDQQLTGVSNHTNDQKQNGYSVHSILGWLAISQPMTWNPVNQVWIYIVNECVYCCS